MPSKPNADTKNELRLQARREARQQKKILEIEQIEYEQFLESEKIRLENELKKIELEKIKLEEKLEAERLKKAENDTQFEARREKKRLENEKMENERLARIAYYKKKQEAEDAKIAERRERQKLAAEKSGGGEGFKSRGKRQLREENEPSDDDEPKDSKRRC